MGSFLSFVYYHNFFIPPHFEMYGIPDGLNMITNYSFENIKAYLNVYKSNLDSAGTEGGHHAIILDIANETTDQKYPKGVMIHLVVPDSKNNQFVECAVHRYQKDSPLLLKSIFLGIASIPKDLNEIPISDPFDLKAWLQYRYFFFIKTQCNGIKKWSNQVNCHKYSSFVVKDLGLQWPEEVSNFKDYPWALDLLSFYRDIKIY